MNSKGVSPSSRALAETFELAFDSCERVERGTVLSFYKRPQP